VRIRTVLSAPLAVLAVASLAACGGYRNPAPAAAAPVPALSAAPSASPLEYPAKAPVGHAEPIWPQYLGVTSDLLDYRVVDCEDTDGPYLGERMGGTVCALFDEGHWTLYGATGTGRPVVRTRIDALVDDRRVDLAVGEFATVHVVDLLLPHCQSGITHLCYTDTVNGYDVKL